MFTAKVNKAIELLHKLPKTLLRLILITMYKGFVRPHLYYGDIVYDEAYNITFHQRIEFVQYNACLAISGAK